MRILCFTDIHFGARGNSDEHLQDCLDYVDWLVQLVQQENISHVAFLGDWMENRNAINVKTLKASQDAARKMNNLGIPVFFIIGNHDLYHRSNRSIFSTDPFNDLENFVLISEPLELTSNLFAAPFLFSEEYPNMAAKINSYKYVLGHFEFRDFVVTGNSRKLDHGPDACAFNKPKYILSGHFHKRQVSKNVVYIGNTFPTSYGDAGDSERGCAVLDTETEELYFLNYEQAPLFYKTKMSDILAAEPSFKKGSRVKCIIDIDIGYSEIQALRAELTEQFELREFCVEEDSQSNKDSLTIGNESVIDEGSFEIHEVIQQLLSEGVQETHAINSDALVQLYNAL